MRLYLLLVFVVLTIASCRKTYTYNCAEPYILLLPQGYTAQEWDTIITRVYDVGFQEPYVADTFIAQDLEDVLLIIPERQDVKDFEIVIPSVNKTYRLNSIIVVPQQVEVRDDRGVECYNDLTVTLDGNPNYFYNVAKPILYLQR